MHPRLLVAILPLIAMATACRAPMRVVVPDSRPAALNVDRFDRILVAGFISAPDAPVDTNNELARLLRTRMRSGGPLQVIETEPLTLTADRIDDRAFWRRVGEEYLQPLIVAGGVRFSTASRRATDYELETNVVFIDGESGAVLLRRAFRGETVTANGDAVPPLAAFFMLADAQLPGVLAAVRDGEIQSERLLLH